MPSKPVESPKWNSPEGHGIIQAIAVSQTTWKAGLCDYQLEVVSEVLDGTDFIYIDTTGSGKSCTFSFPILVLLHYNQSPSSYPRGYRTKEHPVGIVVTPTKGLAYNLVRGHLYSICS
jgi:superfamily II DNA helicase RecQ